MAKQTMTLRTRVAMHADSVRIIDAKLAHMKLERVQVLDELAKAEAEVLGHAPDSAGIPLSGLIADGKNPYYEAPKAEKPIPETKPEPKPEPKKESSK
jgi:hypothetical protein